MGEGEIVPRVSKAKTVVEKKICDKCKKPKNLKDDFYSADETLYHQGKFHLCKICVEDIINTNGFDGFLVILRAMNKPFIQDVYKGDWKDYIRQINSLPQYRNFTYIHGDSISPNSKIQTSTKEKHETEGLSEEALRRWDGFEPEKMRKLEDFYQELISTYEHGTPIQRNLYRNITITQIQANEAINDHKKYRELMETLSKLMNDANIKPVQETGAEANGISSFGEFIKMIEETEPIPEPREEFKDVDGIGKYIDKWFLHHMRRFLGMTNETMEEYDEKQELKDHEKEV